MAPSKRQNNGRSPLVNPQRQITSFFSKTTSPSPSPSPSPSLSKLKPNKFNSNANANPNPSSSRSPSPSPSPTTPSPLQSRPKKPLLIIGRTPSPSPSTEAASTTKSFAEEVVEKRIRVYWPLDKVWYEGCVKSFDKDSNKHLVLYDDGEEEMLDLGKEKIEWMQVSTKRYKRLRRGSSLVFKKVVIDDDGEAEEKHDNMSESSDDDWDKNVETEKMSDDEDMDLVDEKEEEEKVAKGRKRKANGGGKECKSGGDTVKRGSKVSVTEPMKIVESEKVSAGFAKALGSDAPERFHAREAEKLRFLGPERRDAKGRRPGDVNYDTKTLYLPPHFLKSLSDGQKQWWEFKSKHMDKVIFFKMGKFYELFEMDAHIGAKELDLQYMKGEQPHCGFPERNFSLNVEKLARKGYRVLVVEQTETPDQLDLRRKEKGSKDKVVKREICGVVTKGTLTEGELMSANPDASYLMAVTESCHISESPVSEIIFGISIVDVATSRIILGQVHDDVDRTALCCLLSELRPVEIIKPANMLSPETERAVVRHTRNPLMNELVPVSEFWDAEKTVQEIKAIYKRLNFEIKADSHAVSSHAEEDDSDCLPGFVSELVSAGENGSLALSALGGTLYYLKQAFLDETLIRFAKFELLPCSGYGDIAQKPYMVLDAAALENLEIFENNINGDSSGTLYAQLNHCVTAFGKRLLKTWLARPLYNLGLIKERQDAVAGLRGINLPFALEFRKTLSRLPDMERLLAHIFACSDGIGRNANKVVLYEDAAKKQLQEFISALRGCELMAQACCSLGVILENTESRLLHHILSPGDLELLSVLKHFKDAFDWVEANNSGRIIPHEGADLEYDSASKTVKEIESSLKTHLKDQRKLLGDYSIDYVTVGKDSYLLDVPESLHRSVPRDYELRSSKKGCCRYWTPTIKKLLGELSQAESEKEAALRSIMQRLMGQFSVHHHKWRQLVSAVAELDVLISLAIASDFYEGPTCQPLILASSSSNEVPIFSAKSLGHPVLRSDSLGKGPFVPNDIVIGGSGSCSFILLTGPNMGGKSTLLRQVCLAVILAQIGADVPAESFELSAVDRIFVRMGAKDHIMAGQSTFLTELSETAVMLSSATRNSLVVLDELGRGTSTSDGQAIAESVLEHFVSKVQCRGMFSTHYHRLPVDYKKDPRVALCHMACQVEDGVRGVEEVTFLYRLSAGPCPKSYGVNVARLAGLPESVLEKATAKSTEFEATYGKHRKTSEEKSIFYPLDKMTGFIRSLINVAANLSCENSSDNIRSLNELQHRARVLMQQN